MVQYAGGTSSSQHILYHAEHLRSLCSISCLGVMLEVKVAFLSCDLQVARLAKKLPIGNQVAMAAQLSSGDSSSVVNAGDGEGMDPDDLT